MNKQELKNAAKEYVTLCLDEVKDESYDYAEDELGLGPDQCSEFANLVTSVQVK